MSKIRKCNGCIFLGVFHDMGASTPLCTRGNKGLVEAINAYDGTKPCEWHITKEQVEQMQNKEAPKPRLTRYDKNLGQYIVPLYSEGPTLNIRQYTPRYGPDAVWGDIVDALAEYENREEAQLNE